MVTKDEAREECWFQLPATNAGVLAEAASVLDRSVCSSAKAATTLAGGTSMAGCPVRASRQLYATSLMTMNKNYLFSLSFRTRVSRADLRRMRQHTRTAVREYPSNRIF
jgi:hypothetical protein